MTRETRRRSAVKVSRRLVVRQLLLKELNLGPHKYEFSSMAVALALEGKASHRELTSRLLADLSGKMLTQGDMARAFDKMLRELPDLLLDTPEAPQVSYSGTCSVMSSGMRPALAKKEKMRNVVWINVSQRCSILLFYFFSKSSLSIFRIFT